MRTVGPIGISLGIEPGDQPPLAAETVPGTALAPVAKADGEEYKHADFDAEDAEDLTWNVDHNLLPN
jgi:hypothetical protein